jgi:hypothetical protein
MIEVRRFKAEDYAKAVGENGPGWMDTLSITREKEGKSFSFYDGDECVAACGLNPLWEGVAEAWLVHDKRFYKYKRDIARLSGICLEWMQLGIRHLFCDTLARDKNARGYLEHFGFKASGYFEAFTEEGDDVMRYSRVAGG